MTSHFNNEMLIVISVNITNNHVNLLIINHQRRIKKGYNYSTYKTYLGCVATPKLRFITNMVACWSKCSITGGRKSRVPNKACNTSLSAVVPDFGRSYNTKTLCSCTCQNFSAICYYLSQRCWHSDNENTCTRIYI